jgi:diguanylate cyclase (GGDEF)-like protein
VFGAGLGSYHPQVTSPNPAPRFSLLDAARVLAHGRDLGAKLDALAEHTRALAGGGAAFLVFDSDTAQLSLPDASASAALPTEGALAEVARDRKPVWSANLPTSVAMLLPGVAGTSAVAVIPLVVDDERGIDVVGLLFADSSAGMTAPDTQDSLLAVADLAAVAVRASRLHNELSERSEYTERLARTDPLTGLADRRTFEQMLELELARATRQSTPLAIAVFDVDGLEAINMEHGAGVGDDILRYVAATLADRVRLIDTVARIGEDEFAVLAPGDSAGIVAIRVRDAVAQLDPVGAVRISVSAGVAHHPADGTTGADLLAAAVDAVGRARTQGAGAVVGLREPDPKS